MCIISSKFKALRLIYIAFIHLPSGIPAGVANLLCSSSMSAKVTLRVLRYKPAFSSQSVSSMVSDVDRLWTLLKLFKSPSPKTIDLHFFRTEEKFKSFPSY